MPTDYLADPLEAATARGAARAYTDLGYAAPHAPLGADDYATPALRAATGRVAAAKTAKAFDPLDDPIYKQAALTRKELHANEQFYNQRLKDFDTTEGAPLKFKPDTSNPDAVRTAPNLASDIQDQLATDPSSPRLLKLTRQRDLLAQKRQRLADEAQRISKARMDFDESTFVPLRERLMAGAAPASATPERPSAQDYLAPDDGSPLASRISEINQRRQRIGIKPIAPGSVSAGNFTEHWGPINEPPIQTPQAPETQSEGPEEADSRFSSDGIVAPPISQSVDALGEAERDASHQAMATDLKSRWGGGSTLDRAKLAWNKLFGASEGIQSPIDLSVGRAAPVGSEAAGTTGELLTIPKMQGDGIMAGVVNAANKFSSKLITPENATIGLATSGLGGLARVGAGTALGTAAQVAKTGAVAGFTAEMAAGLPDSVKEAYRVYNDPASTPAQKAEALTTPGLEALMTGLAAHGTVAEARGVAGTIPDRVSAVGGAKTGTGDMLRQTLVATGKYTPEQVAEMSDLAAHATLQAEMRKGVVPAETPAEPAKEELARDLSEPVDIGARDTSVSTGTGVETPHETAMMEDWRKQIADEMAARTTTEGEPNDAATQQSPNALDVQPAPGNGETVGGGNAVDQETAGALPLEETDTPGLSGGGGEPAAKVVKAEHIGEHPAPYPEATDDISSESTTTSENTGETSNDTRGEQRTNAQTVEPRGNGGNPDVEQHAGTGKPDLEQPNRGGGSEQPRGSPVDGPAVSGESGGGAANADERQPGDAGGRLTEPAGIGIKNASVEDQRKEFGLPPAPERKGLAEADAVAQADAAIKADPKAGTKLVEDLTNNPRAATGVEDAILANELTRIDNERKAAGAELDKAISEGDLEGQERAQLRINNARDEFDHAGAVADATGTKQSDALRLRQTMLKEDFSISSLEREQKRLNRGEPITPEQQQKIKSDHAEFEKTLREYQDKLASHEQRIAELEAKQATDKVVKDVAAEPKAKATPGRVRQFISEHAADARARILDRMKQGKIFDITELLSPEELRDYAYVTAEYIAKGIDAGTALVREFGEKIKPHLAAIMAKVKEVRDEAIKKANSERDIPAERASTVEAMRAKIKEGASVSDLGLYAHKIAEQHVREGITGHDELLDAVHGTLKQLDPNITRRQAMDAVSGYGKVKPLNPDAIKAKLRDLKGQYQQVGKLQDMQSGQAPLKTGVERRIPSDEERRLIKQVEEAKKKGGYKVTDPANQLKSALDSIKTRLKNQIKDLDFQISTGKKIVRSKTETPVDAETKSLIEQRDALKKRYDEIFTKPELTDAQRLAIADKHAERQIAGLAYQLRTGELFPGGKRVPLSSPELDAKRARIKALQEEREYARHVLQPKPEPATPQEVRVKALDAQIVALEKQLKSGELFPGGKKAPIESTPEIKAREDRLVALKNERQNLRDTLQPKANSDELQAHKVRVANQIAELEERLAKGDFSKTAPRIPREMDSELATAKANLERTKQKIREGQKKQEDANRPGWVNKLDYAAKFVRGGVLSWPTTIGKLAATTIQQGILHPLDEMAGSVAAKAFPQLMGKAKIEGTGFNIRQQAKAISDGIIKGWGDLKDTLNKAKGNRSEIEALHGKNGMPPEAVEFFGLLHGAEKAPLKRFAFSYAMQKQVAWALAHGVDHTDPLVQMRMGSEAYKYANRMLFQEDNVVSSAFNRALTAFREPSKESGRQSIPALTGETLARILLPVSKIGTNIGIQTFQRALGWATAPIEVANAYRRGIENLKPEEADMIARHLKKGNVGLALGTLAFLYPKIFGGFYRQGEKRDPTDVKAGEIKSPVQLPHLVSKTGNIPAYLNHGAGSETMHFYATMRRVMDSKFKKSDTENQGVGAGVLAASAGLISENPMVRVAADAVGGLHPGGAGKFAGNIARNAVPGFVQWSAQQLDRNAAGDVTARKPTNFTQTIEQGIPGMRSNVPQASYVDPVLEKQIGDLGIQMPAMTRPRLGPPNNKRSATDAEFLAFQKEVGQELTSKLRNEVHNLKTLPRDKAEARIKKMAEDAHVKARIDLEIAARRHPQRP